MTSVAFGQDPAPTANSGTNLTAGQKLYAVHCAGCHGTAGDGKGVATLFLYPKPRDFRRGKFRLVSTIKGAPTREDLNAVMLRGMPGSSMPSWGHLPQKDRDLILDEVVRLYREGAADRYIANLKDQEQLTDEEIKADDVQEEIKEFVQRQTTPEEIAEVPELPKGDAAAVSRGKELYVKQSCHSCHGNEGKGDGAAKMIDDEGFATRPRDLTRGIYKGGDDLASLYRRIYYGMPGTPMPASKNLTPEQTADMIHFLRSLSTEETRERSILKREKIVAKKVAALPADSDPTAWQAAAPVEIRLMPLWWRDDAIFSLKVQAVHDGRDIALRLEWEDSTADTHAGKTEAFKDAAAMELVAGGDELFLGMGGTSTPVDLWMWDADRGQKGGDLEEVNPRIVVDQYPFSEASVETAEFARQGTKTSQQPDVSLPAKAAGNQVVRSAPYPTGGSSLSAAGPGSTTFRFVKSQLVVASARYSKGRWTVLLRRTLDAGAAENGIRLAPGQTASVAFAVWDGAHRDRNGQKQVSIWQDLVLEAPR
ncbi:MAG TPA: ethylbenzene dehydrogenase-related protein [Pirellulaceae bacterium]|nr:ethylbenzene dehydrogenase-related protein [Pirellulaceae bacterium]